MTVRTRPSGDLATQAARLFFDRRLNKVEIGRRLGISRFRVARLIDQAVGEGLVRIEYRDAPAVDRALAESLERRFGLDLCVVASAPEGAGLVTAGIAGLAATLVGGLIVAGDVVGIAWGSTLASVVGRLDRQASDGVSVVQLAGSSNRLDRGLEPGEVSRILADRLGATHHPIFAPAFVDQPAVREAMLRQPELAETVVDLDRLTMAIVGIGAMGEAGGAAPSSSLLRSGVLTEREVARLRARGAVGELVVHPFDLEGRFVAPELADRAVAVGVDQLRRTRRVIAVAAGTAKAAAIRGALRSRVVTILITDQATARAVIELDDELTQPAPGQARGGRRIRPGRPPARA